MDFAHVCVFGAVCAFCHLPGHALPMPRAFYLHLYARPLLRAFHIQTLCACPWALLCPVCMADGGSTHALLDVGFSLALERELSLSSLQLLVVSFIVWSSGVSVTRSWLWIIRGVLSFYFDTRVKKIRNEVCIRQNLLHSPLLLLRVSKSLGLMTGSQRYFCLRSEFFLDQIPFLRGGS